MENINTIELYFKAENVLDSCDNLNQLRAALKYAELYYGFTKDKSGYEVLVRKYHKLVEEFRLDEKTENN